MPSYREGMQPHNHPKEKVEKIPHVKLQRASDKMTEGQKEGVRVWNLMVKTLIQHGLMEEK